MSQVLMIGGPPSLEEFRRRFNSADTHYGRGLVISEIRQFYLSEEDEEYVRHFGETEAAPCVHPNRQQAKALVSELCEQAQSKRWMRYRMVDETHHFRQRLRACID